MKRWISAFLLVIGSANALAWALEKPYEPKWESLDRRPIPAWYDEAKFGIFVVWGIYSVPAWAPKGEYAEWYGNRMLDQTHPIYKFHRGTYGEKFAYPDFVTRFTAELFHPQEWAEWFKASGARYVVMTANYHDGFCLWPSSYQWNWNSTDIGPHRDLVGELTEAVRKTDLKMGYYYSLYEWYHPAYRNRIEEYVEKHLHPQFKELVQRYRPSIIFADGEWDQTSQVWQSEKLLAWLYNESACRDEIVVNDRWGKETRGKHGGYYTSEYGQIHGGQFPNEAFRRHKWEENRGMGASYGFNRNESIRDYKSATELIRLLIDILSLGGNLLLDVGPTADGRIPVIMQERLLEIGEWLQVNGEAVYGTKAWRVNAEGDHVRYTAKGDSFYAFCLGWPGKELRLAAPKAAGDVQVTMLGLKQDIPCRRESDGLHIKVPQLTIDQLPCRHAYVFKLKGVE